MVDVLNNILYDAFAEASENVYIYVTDMDTGITRWSKNAVRYFDIGEEYVKNTLEIWIPKVHPDDRAGYVKDIDDTLSGEKARHAFQYRVLNRFGEYVWVECNGAYYRSESGKAVFAGLLTRLDVQSAYDALTGLPSANLFYQCDFKNSKGLVMLLGVDDFKDLIATFGYTSGDNVLVKIGMLFMEAVGKNNCFRFNGDEFIIVLPEAGEAKAIEFFRAIQENIYNITLENGYVTRLSFSAGAVTYPFDNYSYDELINRLKSCLDYAKKNHKGGIEFYTDEVEKTFQRKQLLKEELEYSIDHDFEGFELFYQPWVDSDGMTVVGCEALLRWKGRTIDNAGPFEFIPILEESNRILAVGKWVAREGMKQQQKFNEMREGFLVSINVSYRQFLEPGYVEEMIAYAKEYNVNPSHMVLELTESCDVDSPELLADVFKELQKAGFIIALDDFGTGYASLSMLKLLPADGVKIEHNFVRELSNDGHDDDFAIIEAIFLLCERMGIKVVVEGVENADVDAIIRKMNPDYMQGYYYSKPICRSEFEKLLN